MPFPFLLLPVLAAPPSAPPFQVKFSETRKVTNTGVEYNQRISLYQRGNRKWSRPTSRDEAILFPRKKLVIYHHEGVQIARRFDGRQAWAADGEIMWPVGGGNVFLGLPFDGVGGVSDRDKVTDWPDVYENDLVAAYEVNTGKLLWESNMKAVGYPVWTNGKVFFAVRMDLSKRAVRRVARGKGRLPVWLEEREVHSRKLRWCMKLTGYPPGLSRVIPCPDRQVTLVFSRVGDIPYGGGGDETDRFLYYPSRLRVTVPCIPGRSTTR